MNSGDSSQQQEGQPAWARRGLATARDERLACQGRRASSSTSRGQHEGWAGGRRCSEQPAAPRVRIVVSAETRRRLQHEEAWAAAADKSEQAQQEAVNCSDQQQARDGDLRDDPEEADCLSSGLAKRVVIVDEADKILLLRAAISCNAPAAQVKQELTRLNRSPIRDQAQVPGDDLADSSGPTSETLETLRERRLQKSTGAGDKLFGAKRRHTSTGNEVAGVELEASELRIDTKGAATTALARHKPKATTTTAKTTTTRSSRNEQRSTSILDSLLSGRLFDLLRNDDDCNNNNDQQQQIQLQADSQLVCEEKKVALVDRLAHLESSSRAYGSIQVASKENTLNNNKKHHRARASSCVVGDYELRHTCSHNKQASSSLVATDKLQLGSPRTPNENFRFSKTRDQRLHEPSARRGRRVSFGVVEDGIETRLVVDSPLEQAPSKTSSDWRQQASGKLSSTNWQLENLLELTRQKFSQVDLSGASRSFKVASTTTTTNNDTGTLLRTIQQGIRNSINLISSGSSRIQERAASANPRHHYDNKQANHRPTTIDCATTTKTMSSVKMAAQNDENNQQTSDHSFISTTTAPGESADQATTTRTRASENQGMMPDQGQASRVTSTITSPARHSTSVSKDSGSSSVDDDHTTSTRGSRSNNSNISTTSNNNTTTTTSNTKKGSRVESIMANAKLRQEEFARLLEEHEQIVNEINRVETKMSSTAHSISIQDAATINNNTTPINNQDKEAKDKQ